MDFTLECPNIHGYLDVVQSVRHLNTVMIKPLNRLAANQNPILFLYNLEWAGASPAFENANS